MCNPISDFTPRADGMDFAAGLSSSVTDQLQEILGVVETALKDISSSHRAEIQRQVKRDALNEDKKAEERVRRERIKRGTWHDGRLDCVAGTGVMCELGIGDEKMEDDSEIDVTEIEKEKEVNKEEVARKRRSVEDMQMVGSLPVVVIRNFAAKGGGSQEALLGSLAQWAATLAENQVCMYPSVQIRVLIQKTCRLPTSL